MADKPRRAPNDEEGDNRLVIGGQRILFLSAPVDGDAELPQLSAAERAVARLVARGLSNAEIAEARGVSERTIANQLASIYDKLGVGSRVELVALVVGGSTG